MALDRSDSKFLGPLTAAMFACVVSVSPLVLAQDGGPIIIGEHEKLKFFEFESFVLLLMPIGDTVSMTAPIRTE